MSSSQPPYICTDLLSEVNVAPVHFVKVECQLDRDRNNTASTHRQGIVYEEEYKDKFKCNTFVEGSDSSPVKQKTHGQDVPTNTIATMGMQLQESCMEAFFGFSRSAHQGSCVTVLQSFAIGKLRYATCVLLGYAACVMLHVFF